MLKYRDRRTGRVSEMPEPPDIMAAAKEAAKDVNAKQAEAIMAQAEQDAAHARRTIARMDEATRWERFVEPDPEPEPEKPVAKRTAAKKTDDD